MKPRMIYTGIRVRELDRSIKFYTEILGMELVQRYKTEETEGEIAMLRSPETGLMLELNWYREGSRFGTSYVNGSELDHLAFDVEDLDNWIRIIEDKGVKVLFRPKEIAGWNEAFIEDPDGIWIEFLQRR